MATVIVEGRVPSDGGAVLMPSKAGLGVTLDHTQLDLLHEQYRHCAVRTRDDLSQMRKYDPRFSGKQPRF